MDLPVTCKTYLEEKPERTGTSELKKSQTPKLKHAKRTKLARPKVPEIRSYSSSFTQRKLRPRETQGPADGHTESVCVSQGVNPSILSPGQGLYHSSSATLSCGGVSLGVCTLEGSTS